jgi:hypothetical protein
MLLKAVYGKVVSHTQQSVNSATCCICITMPHGVLSLALCSTCLQTTGSSKQQHVRASTVAGWCRSVSKVCFAYECIASLCSAWTLSDSQACNMNRFSLCATATLCSVHLFLIMCAACAAILDQQLSWSHQLKQTSLVTSDGA